MGLPGHLQASVGTVFKTPSSEPGTRADVFPDVLCPRSEFQLALAQISLQLNAFRHTVVATVSHACLPSAIPIKPTEEPAAFLPGVVGVRKFPSLRILLATARDLFHTEEAGRPRLSYPPTARTETLFYQYDQAGYEPRQVPQARML